MRRVWFITGLALAVSPAYADTNPFAASTRVSDAELATMRGGFALPNGVDISLAVQTDAAIDGALVLRTVFLADQGLPTLAVYAPAPGTTGPSWTAAPQTAATATTPPVLLLDRVAGTTVLQPGTSVPTSVSVSTGPTPTIGAPAGLAPLNAVIGGAGVKTGAEIVWLSTVPIGTRIDLNGTMVDITQLVSAAFINAVKNSGNNRVIDTATTINIDLHNTAGIAAASNAARISGVVDQIASRIVR